MKWPAIPGRDVPPCYYTPRALWPLLLGDVTDAMANPPFSTRNDNKMNIKQIK